MTPHDHADHEDPVDGEIVDEALEVLGRLETEPEDRAVLERALTISFWHYELPRPDLFSQYSPAAQQEYLDAWRDSREAEREVDRGNLLIRKRGQIWAGSLSVLCLLIALVLGLAEQPVVAGVIGGSTVVSLATAFVFARRGHVDKDESVVSENGNRGENELTEKASS